MTSNLLPSPKAIIFDWDGVLVQSLGFIKEAFQFTLQKVQPLHKVDIEALPALSLRNYFPTLFGEKAESAEKVFYTYVYENHLKALNPTTGAESLLETLQGFHIPLFIISNKKGELLRKEVDYLSWTRYFKDVIGAGDCSEDKPSVVPVIKALSAIWLDPSHNVWFVGDTAIDMECASQSGCFGVLMIAEKKCLNNKAIDANMVVSSCEDLKGKVINNKI